MIEFYIIGEDDEIGHCTSIHLGYNPYSTIGPILRGRIDIVHRHITHSNEYIVIIIECSNICHTTDRGDGSIGPTFTASNLYFNVISAEEDMVTSVLIIEHLAIKGLEMGVSASSTNTLGWSVW